MDGSKKDKQNAPSLREGLAYACFLFIFLGLGEMEEKQNWPDYCYFVTVLILEYLFD